MQPNTLDSAMSVRKLNQGLSFQKCHISRDGARPRLALLVHVRAAMPLATIGPLRRNENVMCAC